MGKHADLSLVRTLLCMAHVRAGAVYEDEARHTLRAASQADWVRALHILRWHRLVPLAGCALASHGLEDAVPQDVLTPIRRARRLSAVVHRLRFHYLEQILQSLRAYDITPVVWKGAALANLFYPEVSARQIADLDLLIRDDHRITANNVLTDLGFLKTSQVADATGYRKEPEGVELDLHHRCRLFEPHRGLKLTIDCQPKFLPLDTIRVYEPNVMLVHLIIHMNEHRFGSDGYFLPWIYDIGLLIKNWGSQLDPDRLYQLLPSRKAHFWLQRTVGFLKSELGVHGPPFLTDAAASVRPYTLAEVLRSRRVKLWGLPGPRGWARLVVHRLRLRPIRSAPAIRPTDPLWHLMDVLREKRAERRSLAKLVPNYG